MRCYCSYNNKCIEKIRGTNAVLKTVSKPLSIPDSDIKIYTVVYTDVFGTVVDTQLEQLLKSIPCWTHFKPS